MIKLKPFNRPCFDKLISWVNSEEALVQFAGFIFTFPLTHQQLEKYLEDKNRMAYTVIHLPFNTCIGHAEISLQNEATAILCRILIGEPVYRNQGLGQQIVNKLLEISFTQFAKEKAELNVFDWNINAIKCYEKVGFSINPYKIRKSEVNGETWTALNMTINKNRWEMLQQNA